METTYIDPAKSVSRDRIREFIGRNYARPSKLSVLCFPGAEAQGQEALEVKEVYDPLNIPRENITGLEYDKKKAHRLQDAGLGIEAVCTDDISFLQQTNRTFDIISLDYTSNFGGRQRYAIDLIAGRKLLGKRGTLITNYYGAREGKFASQDLLFVEQLRASGLGYDDFAKDPAGTLDKMEAQDVKIKNARSYGIQSGIFSSLTWGEGALDPFKLEPLSKNAAGFRGYINDLAQAQGEEGLKMEGRDFYEKLARSAFYRGKTWGEMIDSAKRKNLSPDFMYHLWMFVMKSYYLKDHTAYSYISNKGSPMLMDCWQVEDSRTRIRDDFYTFQGPGKILTLAGHSHKKCAKLLKKREDFVEEAFGQQAAFFRNPKREFLGSSYKPGARKKKLDKVTKEDAIELLADGIPVREIVETFSGFTEHQLRAFKAHITMGTYKDQVC